MPWKSWWSRKASWRRCYWVLLDGNILGRCERNRGDPGLTHQGHDTFQRRKWKWWYWMWSRGRVCSGDIRRLYTWEGSRGFIQKIMGVTERLRRICITRPPFSLIHFTLIFVSISLQYLMVIFTMWSWPMHITHLNSFHVPLSLCSLLCLPEAVSRVKGEGWVWSPRRRLDKRPRELEVETQQWKWSGDGARYIGELGVFGYSRKCERNRHQWQGLPPFSEMLKHNRNTF